MEKTVLAVEENPFEQNRELLKKWLQYLFWVETVIFAVTLIARIPGMGNTLMTWFHRILSISTVVILFKLSPSNSRYRKAAIFNAIEITGALLGIVAGLFTSVCGLVGTYQEYHSHSELIGQRDTYLTDKWNSLFLWEIGIGLIVYLISLAGAVLMMAGELNSDLIVSVNMVVMLLGEVILRVFYLKYLKTMLKMLDE